MQVKKLIELLERFDPEAEVRLGVSRPDRVTQTYQQIWVGDYGGGPQINATEDLRGFCVFVGIGLPQLLRRVPSQPTLDLGEYDDDEMAARVRDFYVYHKGLDEPLNFPDFDYESWIPPRTTSGQYNPHVAAILKDKLLEE